MKKYQVIFDLEQFTQTFDKHEDAIFFEDQLSKNLLSVGITGKTRIQEIAFPDPEPELEQPTRSTPVEEPF